MTRKVLVFLSLVLIILACQNPSASKNQCVQDCIKRKQAQATSIEQIQAECKEECAFQQAHSATTSINN